MAYDVRGIIDGMNSSNLPALNAKKIEGPVRQIPRLIGTMFDGEWKLHPYSEAAHYMARGDATPDGWYHKFRLWVRKGIVDYKIDKHTLTWELRELDSLSDKSDRLVTDVSFEREEVFLFLSFQCRGKRCRHVTELGLYDDPREWDRAIKEALTGWLRMISCIEHGGRS